MKLGSVSNTPASFWMPTHKQLVQAYRSVIDQAIANGTAKPEPPPAGIEKFPSVDLSNGMEGSYERAYIYKGDLWVKSGVVGPVDKPSWLHVGPAPLFMA